MRRTYNFSNSVTKKNYPMSIFTSKMSDEGLLLYVWMGLIFLSILIISAMFQFHYKAKTLETSVFQRVHDIEQHVLLTEKECLTNKNMIVTVTEKEQEIKSRIDQLEMQNEVFARTVKRVEDSSKHLSEGVDGLNKVSAEFTRALGAFSGTTLSTKTQEKKTVTITSPRAVTPEPIKEVKVVKEEKKPEGKRIWWTLGLVKRKVE